MKFICICVLIFSYFLGVLTNQIETKGDLPWDRLSVTWGTFDNLPNSPKEAIQAGWTSYSACNNSNALWPGNMYILGSDLSVIIIYDQSGAIAGIQNGVQSAPTNPNIPPWQVVNSQTYGLYWTLTFYFVDPTTICKSNYKKNFKGIGDRLVLQNGGNTSALISFPLVETDLPEIWVSGQCFYTMGQHYWYNISNSLPCEHFYPVFLMYNGGILNAFGPDLAGNVASPRWENPTGSELDWFFNPNTIPTCLYSKTDLRTMHIYLTSAYFDFC